MPSNRSVKPTQNGQTKTRHYFKPEHESTFPIQITSAFQIRDKNRVSVGYTLYGDSKNFRSPRTLTAWMDGKPTDEVDQELEVWRHRVNGTGKLEMYAPPKYLQIKYDFKNYCLISADISTVLIYLDHMERYVFPFFISRIGIENPAKWNEKYHDWQTFLIKNTHTSRTRDSIKTALRRYFAFLKEEKGKQNLIPPKNERVKKRQREGKSLPGNRLPNYDEVLVWLNTLPEGLERWVITIFATFGVRLSEAMMITPTELIGDLNYNEDPKFGDIIKVVYRESDPKAFCKVKTAWKKEIKDEVEQDDDPKSGEYVAACFHDGLAEFLGKLIENKECPLESPKVNGDYESFIYRIKKIMKQSLHPIFSKYRPHDFRRLSMTLKVLENVKSMFIAGRLHGHVNENTITKYYQWGKEIRDRTPQPFVPIRKVVVKKVSMKNVY